VRQVFLDTETTGLSPESGDRIIEIGCVEIVNRRLTGRRVHFYVNPERRNSIDAYKVHGLSDEFLADKPLFGHIVDELIEFVRDAEIIIHNAAFDVGFLDAELRRLERPVFTSHVGRIVDSLSMARESFPGKSNSLDALCKRFEVNNSMRELHGALLDAGLLAEVYLRMTRGQNSLVIDAADVLAADLAARPIDFSVLELIVVVADEAETSAHEAVLAEIDKASRGHAVWRPAPPATLGLASAMAQ
jgi:DNA polymerase-3 subunit epsilon